MADLADRPLRAGEARGRRADAIAAGRPPHVASPGLLRPDRPAAHGSRRSRRSSTITSHDAFARVVDRLLASPRYGERWGRHWLDVARYADTKDGVLMFGDDRVRPYAYTYRDYVIRAFNEDTPFDQFIHEQLAADVVAPKDQPWRLAAMGFLTLGRMFDNNVHDQIDDRIDTVSRGLLGLTVACARCHDHKYDAIPTADYYSLYGVFASSEAPLELPLIERPEHRARPASSSRSRPRPSAPRSEKFLDSQYKLLLEDARQRRRRLPGPSGD